jgi:polyisoprenoid-binding protein YceI
MKGIVMQAGLKRVLATTRYVIDKTVGQFTVRAFSTGLLSTFGHDPTIGILDYSGEIRFVPDTYENASVRIVLNMLNMEVLDEMRRFDRAQLERTMYNEVLDATHYPEAVFQSSSVTIQKAGGNMLQARVNGMLKLRGITHSQAFDARATDLGESIRISGEFTLLQSDYGIKPVSFAGGALRLKDELKFAFQMIATRQE